MDCDLDLSMSESPITSVRLIINYTFFILKSIFKPTKATLNSGWSDFIIIIVLKTVFIIIIGDINYLIVPLIYFVPTSVFIRTSILQVKTHWKYLKAMFIDE